MIHGKFRHTLLSVGIMMASAGQVWAVPSAQSLPNDPRFHTQWGFEQPNDADVDVMTAWEMVKDKPLQEVVVAVIDTGVDTAHGDLENRLVEGYDFVSGDNDPTDRIMPHGTPIAGIIAAETNNGFSVAGLAGTMPVKVMSLRVLSTAEIIGTAPRDNTVIANRMIAAFNFAIAHNAKVINFSEAVDMALVTSDPVIEAAIKDIITLSQEKGVIIVSGPGNFSSLNPNVFPLQMPNYIGAEIPNLINVASINSRGALAVDWDGTGPEVHDHTSYGSLTDLAAPGTKVESTWPFFDLMDLALLGQDAGTSFATPYVTATVAMAMSAKPELMQSNTPEEAMADIQAIRSALINGVHKTAELQSSVDADHDGTPETPLLKSGGYLKIPLVFEQLGIHLSERNGASVTTYPKAVVYAAESGKTASLYANDIKLPYDNRTITVDGTQSYDNDGHIVEYLWDFGDGTTATGATASHTYAHTGKYQVRLTVRDNDVDASGLGKADISAPQSVEVMPPAYDFVTIRYKEENKAFNQEGMLTAGNIDIVKNSSGKVKLSGTGQFTDENGQVVDVSVTTSYPSWGVVSGTVSFSNPNISRKYSFALINPVKFNAQTNTYSLYLPIMEFHFTEKVASPQ